ncbi:hypothetical protein KVR01_003439 [Diaporthe batatas]|uniref:uncharacterized protein n=1 Tax=Diaporthe batatas TaxID=748121 RepID=UPI001D037C4E|nr:uncharacterized protein KVR01_003439 [Diaporthe batatas]KAG8167750.1 hypothetical protein KVR01_003439 [Diaporthe batatas]
MADDNPPAQQDPLADQPGHYPANDYAIAYESEWSRIHGDDPTLGHLSCNYLGTKGCPPTLLALKQHAQSLAILIARLSPSVRTGVVDGNPIFDNRQVDGGQIRHNVDGRLELNDAFDWLADLSTPYVNDDANHHKPLNILCNEVKSQHEVTGPEFQCPLTQVDPREIKEDRGHPYKENVSLMPYASHHLLAMHANACLEQLDHEFSDQGGILSLIPEEGRGANSAELTAAQNSLLGQLLLYVQSLALRNHEMDMTNAKLTDALAGEAVVPLQHLSVLGPDGRSGREIAFPQDRWVLVNAGDDVFGHLHDTLDREEAALAVREHEWAQDKGLGGDSCWQPDRDRDRLARGVVAVDMKSRFYRLHGQGRSTIFVLPAFASQPGTEWSERMDRYSRPTVVGTVAPRTVQRASEYQKRWTQQNNAAQRAQAAAAQLQDQSARDQATIDYLRAEAVRQDALLRAAQAANQAQAQAADPAQAANQAQGVRIQADNNGDDDVMDG